MDYYFTGSHQWLFWVILPLSSNCNNYSISCLQVSGSYITLSLTGTPILCVQGQCCRTVPQVTSTASILGSCLVTFLSHTNNSTCCVKLVVILGLPSHCSWQNPPNTKARSFATSIILNESWIPFRVKNSLCWLVKALSLSIDVIAE